MATRPGVKKSSTSQRELKRLRISLFGRVNRNNSVHELITGARRNVGKELLPQGQAHGSDTWANAATPVVRKPRELLKVESMSLDLFLF
jgi:hypothetical protein